MAKPEGSSRSIYFLIAPISFYAIASGRYIRVHLACFLKRTCFRRMDSAWHVYACARALCTKHRLHQTMYRHGHGRLSRTTLAVPMGWMPEAHMGTGQWAGPVCMARGCIRGEGVQLLRWRGDTPRNPRGQDREDLGPRSPRRQRDTGRPRRRKRARTHHI